MQPASVSKPPVVQPGSGNNIIINPCQRLNPVLNCVRNVGKEFGDILPDFQVGRTTGVLFLSLKYHRLHPEYIHKRIEHLGHAYSLRILLLMCDVSEHQEPIRELTKMCLINSITVIVAWTIEEAGLYLTTFKHFEHKPPDMIKERVDKDYSAVLRTALTSISKVNKTDVETLRTSLGSFANIAKATAEQLSGLPGFGQVKVKRMKDAFERPFRNKATSSLPFASQSKQSATLNSNSERERDLAKLRDKGKAAATAATSGPSEQRGRDPSPVWDIELDLNDDVPSNPVAPAPARPAYGGSTLMALEGPSRRRPPSPTWDLELDLNPSDDEDEDDANNPGTRPWRKKRRGDEDGT